MVRLELALRPAVAHRALETLPAGAWWPPGRMAGLAEAAGLPLLVFPWTPAGPAHGVLAVLFAWVVGRGCERRIGSAATVVAFVAGGIAAGLAETVLRSRVAAPVAGLGAGVTALIGALLAAAPRSHLAVLVPMVVLPVRAGVPAAVAALSWLVLQAPPVQRLLAPAWLVPLSWAGVGAALAVGAVAGLTLGWWRRSHPRPGQ